MAKSIMRSPRPRWWNKFFSRWSNDPIMSLIHRRAEEVRRGEYEPIGIVDWMEVLQYKQPPDQVSQVSNGCLIEMTANIIFPPPDQLRPSIGRFHSDNQIDFLDPWGYAKGGEDFLAALPTWYELGDGWCTACQSPCTGCRIVQGEYGQTQLVRPFKEYLIAGKKQMFVAGEVPCMHGHFLDVCGGTGKIGDETCPTCGGSGKVQCGRCGGTGMMATGQTPEGKICPACGGTERVRIEHEQPIANYYNPVLSEPGYWAVGPIVAIHVTAPSKFPEIWQGQADMSGQYPHIVVPQQLNAGSRGVLSLCGVLKKQEVARTKK